MRSMGNIQYLWWTRCQIAASLNIFGVSIVGWCNGLHNLVAPRLYKATRAAPQRAASKNEGKEKVNVTEEVVVLHKLLIISVLVAVVLMPPRPRPGLISAIGAVLSHGPRRCTFHSVSSPRLTSPALSQLPKGTPAPLNFSPTKRAHLSSQLPTIHSRTTYARRYFYAHITDAKMAPQLEPFFKQYVFQALCASKYFCNLLIRDLGSMTSLTLSSNVRPSLDVIADVAFVTDLWCKYRSSQGCCYPIYLCSG